MLTASIRSSIASSTKKFRAPGGSKVSTPLLRNACALFRGYLEAHRSEIDVADLDLAAFILVTTVEALTHAAVLHRADVLADEKKVGEFVDEVTRLVLRYLRTSSPLRQSRRAGAQ